MRGKPDEIRHREDDESLVEYYLSESLNGKDCTESTKVSYRSSWSAYTNWVEENGLRLDEISEEEAREFKNYLMNSRDGWTPENYFRRVKIVIEWLTNTKEADYNPFSNVKAPETEGETTKMEVSLDKIRDSVQSALRESIVLFVYLMIALKTGLRSSEIVNLDLRDIHLDHPVSDVMPRPRQEIYNKPDTLYVDSTITEEEVHNGEKRNDGNKDNSTRQIPIDDELKSVLVWWIGMLPPSKSPAEPLLRKVSDPHGERYAQSTMQERVTRWSRNNNLNDKYMTHFGVDSHWCRHWFSTTLRARINTDEVVVGTPKGYVQGLRGDSDDSTIETYTHEWSEVVENGKPYRKVYEDNIPQLLVSTRDD